MCFSDSALKDPRAPPLNTAPSPGGSDVTSSRPSGASAPPGDAARKGPSIKGGTTREGGTFDIGTEGPKHWSKLPYFLLVVVVIVMFLFL